MNARTWWPVWVLMTAAACSGRTSGSGRSETFVAVPNQANATPALAAIGRLVFLSWTASEADGSRVNVYLAASTDAGRTFGAPVRVNDVPDAARNSGEQAPRLALGQKSLAIVWTQKRDGRSEVVYARSRDGGRTFSPSQAVHTDTTGIRGWASASMDRDDRLHVAWLDGRHAAPAPAGTSAPMNHAGHQAGMAMAGSPRQDLFRAAIDADGTRRETLVAAGVCFCCKTAIVLRPDGSLFLAWRHIFPESTRDIAAAVVRRADSTPASFSRVSEDHWHINACPDDGPSATSDGSGGMHIAWPTFVNGRKAIFYASATDGVTFAPREAVMLDASADGSHPQIILADRAHAIVLWDQSAPGGRTIRMRQRDLATGQWTAASTLTAASGGRYPAATMSDGALLVAWASESASRSGITIARVGAP